MPVPWVKCNSFDPLIGVETPCLFASSQVVQSNGAVKLVDCHRAAVGSESKTDSRRAQQTFSVAPVPEVHVVGFIPRGENLLVWTEPEKPGGTARAGQANDLLVILDAPRMT